jgi:ADP-heptose:LPS heptosyltransferase
MSSLERKKLLAINFGGIGDEILFLPVLETVRREFPNFHITLLLEPRSKSVTQVTNLVDAIACFDIKKRPLYLSDLVDLLFLIRDGDFDCVISSGSSKMVALLLFLSGIRERIGYDSGPLSKILLTKAVPLNKNQYAGGMYHDLVAWQNSDATESNNFVPAIILSREAREASAHLLDQLTQNGSATTPGDKQIKDKNLILIHPGTSRLAIEKGIIKTWSTDNWTSLINQLLARKDVQVVLAGGPDDTETIAAILAKLPANSNLLVAAGKTKDLSQLAGLMELSDLIVCVDSAPMHLAVGLKKKLVALFGPTDPKKLLPSEDRFVSLTGKATATGVAISLADVMQAIEKML